MPLLTGSELRARKVTLSLTSKASTEAPASLDWRTPNTQPLKGCRWFFEELPVQIKQQQGDKQITSSHLVKIVSFCQT